MKKYSDNFERDYNFYIQNIDNFTFCTEEINVLYLKDGVDAKEAFFIFDSKGKLVPTFEPELLKSVIFIKKAINFQIIQWASSYNDMFMGVNDYLKIFINPPPWVEHSFRQQLYKKWKNIKK